MTEHSHEILTMAVPIVCTILIALAGFGFHSSMRASSSEARQQLAETKNEIETLISGIEDKVSKFIRDHEVNAFAHPNLESVRRLESKIDNQTAEIVALRLSLVGAKAAARKTNGRA